MEHCWNPSRNGGEEEVSGREPVMHDAPARDYALPCIAGVKYGSKADLVARVGCREEVRQRRCDKRYGVE